MRNPFTCVPSEILCEIFLWCLLGNECVEARVEQTKETATSNESLSTTNPTITNPMGKKQRIKTLLTTTTCRGKRYTKLVPLVTYDDSSHRKERIYENGIGYYMEMFCTLSNVCMEWRQLAREFYNPSEPGERCGLYLACFHGHVPLVKLLLQDPRVSPTCHDNDPLKIAMLNDHAEVVRLILKDPRVQIVKFPDDYVIRSALLDKNALVILWLLQSSKVILGKSTIHAIYETACRCGFLVIVKIILGYGTDYIGYLDKQSYKFTSPDRVYDGNNCNDTTTTGSTSTTLTKVQSSLATVFQGVDYSKNIQRPTTESLLCGFWNACRYGKIHIVRFLLSNEPTIDFFSESDYALRISCSSGQLDVVSLLIQWDKRVDVRRSYSQALTEACIGGFLEVVQLLLKDPRVDPEYEDNLSLRNAVEYRYVSIVKTLLEDPRVDPSAKNNEALQSASLHTSIIILTMLLQHPSKSVDPSAENNRIIYKAVKFGRIDILRALLITDVSRVKLTEKDISDLIRIKLRIMRTKTFIIQLHTVLNEYRMLKWGYTIEEPELSSMSYLDNDNNLTQILTSGGNDFRGEDSSYQTQDG